MSNATSTVLAAIPLMIGTVGGSVALVLGVLKLRELLRKPRMDIGHP